MKKRVLVGFVCIGIFITFGQLTQSSSYADTNKIYPVNTKLPVNISRIINSTVDVEYNNDGDTLEKASGVKLSNNIVISAGHEFLNHGAITSSSTSNYCRNLTIFSYGDDKNNYSSENKLIASYTSNDLSSTDISIINTNGNSNFKNSPNATIGQSPNINDSLYLINYEPDSKLIDRNPTLNNANSHNINPHSLPAIYSGIVLDNSNNVITIATGIQSYGYLNDIYSRAGASGGPVFNSSGQLIGIVKSILSEQLDTATISQMYEVNLSNISKNNLFQIEEIQPITPQILNNYENLLNNFSPNNSVVNGISSCTQNPLLKQSSPTILNKFLGIIKSKATNIISNI